MLPQVLLPSSPIFGHVQPIIRIGGGLRDRGYRVCVLTGSRYRPAVEAAGLRFRPLPAEVDYDDAALDDWLPDRRRYSGVAAGRYAIEGVFLRPLGPQYAALRHELAEEEYDAIVAETGFLGVLPLLLDRSLYAERPILGVSTTPLTLRSVDCAPFGSALAPGRSAFSRSRNRQIDWLLRHGPLRRLQATLDAELAAVGAPASPVSFFDLVALFDLTCHLSVPGLEYPRREQPATVRFVGPLPATDAGFAVPPWWEELTDDRPIVHVTQGTLDNADLTRLLAPTLRGLAREPVWVVASTGGRPVERLTSLVAGRLPGNARVAEFLPYEVLLPRTSVMITNGGFGGVQRALAYGVPLVVAGATEDKPEVAARVSWAGAGRNLRTGTPSAGRVRAAVRTVLRDPRYRESAARLQQEIARHGDPVATVADALAAALGRRIGDQTSDLPA